MKAVPDTACFFACLLVALVLRVAVILHEPEQLAIDRDAYLGIAQSVVDGRGYSSPNSTNLTAFRPPVYPLTLAFGFWLVPRLPVVAEINLVAGLMTVWLTASLGRHLQLGRGRYLAALFVAVDPLLLQYTARPMTETLCTFLISLWLWTVIAVSPKRLKQLDAAYAQLFHGLLVGSAFGLLVLCRPTFWPIAGIFCVWWLLHYFRANTTVPEVERLGWIGAAAGSVFGTAMFVVPWVTRNWLIFGIPILTTTHGGYTLLLGNNPVFYDEVVRKPWGTVWPDESQRQWEADRHSQAERDLGSNFDEIHEDAWNSSQAKSFIASHPQATLEAAWHRFRSLWNVTPQGDASSGINPLVVMTIGLYYSVTLGLSLIGMVLVLRSRNRANWLSLFVLIVSVQAVHLVYWTNTRMRAPLTPALGLFAAAVITAKSRTTTEPADVPKSLDTADS